MYMFKNIYTMKYNQYNCSIIYIIVLSNHFWFNQ